MAGTVKSRTQISIDERRQALRLRVVAGDIAVRAGRRMRRRRLELGLSQPQVALAIRKLLPETAVDKGRVYAWERGENFPSDRYKQAIATVLQVEDRGGFGYFLLEEKREQDPAPDPFSSDGNGGDGQDAVLARLAALEKVVTALDTQLRALAAEEEIRAAEALRQNVEGFQTIEGLLRQRPQ